MLTTILIGNNIFLLNTQGGFNPQTPLSYATSLCCDINKKNHFSQYCINFVAKKHQCPQPLGRNLCKKYSLCTWGHGLCLRPLKYMVLWTHATIARPPFTELLFTPVLDSLKIIAELMNSNALRSRLKGASMGWHYTWMTEWLFRWTAPSSVFNENTAIE